MPEDRGCFIEHRGKRIYFMDLEGLKPDQVVELLPKLARDIRAQPPASVLGLTSLAGIKLERSMLEAIQEFLLGNTPYIKAAAIVGLTPLQCAIVRMGQNAVKREFLVCDTLEEAKDLLVALP